MIVIISDDEREDVGKSIYEYFQRTNVEVEYISASNRDIKPCYSCNGCVDKTYGKCVVRDDMDQILPVLLEGDVLIYTSPLMWGGFSYDIKKILDKTSLIGYRFYNIMNKELVKGTISKNKKIIGIGVSDDVSSIERTSFENLIKEIGTIMNIDHGGMVVDTSINESQLHNLIKEMLPDEIYNN